MQLIMLLIATAKIIQRLIIRQWNRQIFFLNFFICQLNITLMSRIKAYIRHNDMWRTAKKNNILIQSPCDSKISNVKSTSCKFAWRIFFRECQHRVISLECIVSLRSKVMAISKSNYDDARLLLFFSN